jgi:beta-galactosidase
MHYVFKDNSETFDTDTDREILATLLKNYRAKVTDPQYIPAFYQTIDTQFGGDYQKYTSPVSHAAACTVTAYATAEGLLESATTNYDFELFVDKSGWKLVSADSQHGGNEAKLAFDGKTGTFWHTEYQGSEPQCPHTIVVDMNKIYKVTAFTYLARQDGTQNGMVKAYEVYLSTDGKSWGQPVATGEFTNTTAMQVAKLKKVTTGRYLKLVAKSEINGKAWSSAAEIGIQCESEPTAVNQAVASTAKSDEDTFYDLQGRKVSSPEKGNIYIQNGKKVLR